MDSLNTINQFLVSSLGENGPMIVVGLVGVLMVLVALPVVLRKELDPMEKLQKNINKGKDTGALQAKLRQERRNKKLEKYANFLEPQNEKDLSDMKLKLLQAGYRSRDAVRIFHFSQFAFGILGLVLGLLYYLTALGGQPVSTQQTLLYILGPGGVGYIFPKYWVTRLVATRKEEIQDGFPDALDMMLICVEAGQSLDQAILRVSRELRSSCLALSEELQIVSLEMKAGKDKATVLADMAERAGVADVSSFVTVLIQSQSFGTSISEALRVYAGEMRDKRVMRAEEKANKLPTKMTLSTMMFTVPPLLLILVGPSVVGVANFGGQ